MDADEETRSLLRTYGEANTPSPQARERAWASLAAATAAPTGPGAPPAPTSALGWKLGIALGALAVGGVALVLGFRGGDASSSRVAPAASAPDSAAAPSSAASTPSALTAPPLAPTHEEPPRARPPTERVEPPRGETPSASPPADRHAPPADRHASPADRPAPPADRPAPPGPATLGEELRLLRLARSSLSAGDSGAALRALDDHAARFPAGVLAAERDVTRVLVLCETGRRAEARALASGRGAPAMARALTRCESEPQP